MAQMFNAGAPMPTGPLQARARATRSGGRPARAGGTHKQALTGALPAGRVSAQRPPPSQAPPPGGASAGERPQLLARLADVKVRLLAACGPKKEEYWRLLNLFLHGQVSKHELELKARARGRGVAARARCAARRGRAGACEARVRACACVASGRRTRTGAHRLPRPSPPCAAAPPPNAAARRSASPRRDARCRC
jgi:hypothetical protein